MLNAIKTFFQEQLTRASDPDEATAEHAIQLATAALLIEVSRADSDVYDEERRAVTRALESAFQLSPDEIRTLIQLAEEEVRQATDLFQFTSLINKEFSPKQKISVVEHLWNVAFADKELEKHEEYIIRKASRLLHVHHKDFIEAKRRVKERAGRTTEL